MVVLAHLAVTLYMIVLVLYMLLSLLCLFCLYRLVISYFHAACSGGFHVRYIRRMYTFFAILYIYNFGENGHPNSCWD